MSKSYTLVDCTRVRRITVSGKGMLVEQDLVEEWVPISMINKVSEVQAYGIDHDFGTLVIPEWLALDKELDHYPRVSPNWRKPATSYSQARRERIIERFEGAEDWVADGTKVSRLGKVLGEFEDENDAAIAGNAARIVCEVLGELAAVQRWAAMMTGRPEEQETKAIETTQGESDSV